MPSPPDDPDFIDPDPEGKKSGLGDTAWLDHCREADAFLIDALDVLRADLATSSRVTASRRKETQAAMAGVESVRKSVTARPVETLVKIANLGNEAWVTHCAAASRSLEVAISLLEKPLENDDGMVLRGVLNNVVPEKRARVAQGLRRAKVVVSRVTPQDAKNLADQEGETYYPKSPNTKPKKKQKNANTSEKTAYTLTYLNIKGLAEPVRLAMRIGGLAFEERTTTYEDLALERSRDVSSTSLPYGQLPTLAIESNSKTQIFAQSPALLRYVGRLCGLYPVDSLLQLRVDGVEECLCDLRKTFTPLWYRNALGRDPGCGELCDGTALSEEQFQAAVTAVSETHLPARLVQIENILGSGAGLGDLGDSDTQQTEKENCPYVCGADITIADISLYVLLAGLEKTCSVPYCAPVCETGVCEKILQERCPKLKALYQAVGAREDVKAWNVERWGSRRA